MSDVKTKELENKKMRVRAEIFHNLTEIIELYPTYTISQHLTTILRRKDPKAKEAYQWTNDELLKRIEQHKAELEGDDLMNDLGEE